jgi:hypothetical protein
MQDACNTVLEMPAAQALSACTTHSKSVITQIAFTISQNEKRRQMNDGQRAYCASLTVPFFEAEARTRQAHGKTAPGKRLPPIGGKRPRGPTATADAALAFNTSARTVQRAKFIRG